jgi:hypothetical protein
MHKYKVKYILKSGEFLAEDIKRENDEGACDAIIIHSIIFPPDGSRSEVIYGKGADGEPITDIEMFKSWTMMASRLAASKELDTDKKQLCGEVFEQIRMAILRASALEEQDAKETN